MGERLFLNTARSATAPTPAAAAASPTCATTTGCTAASRRRSASRSPTAAWASCRRWAPALGEDDVKNVVAYVRSLSGLPHDGLQGPARQARVRAELRRVPRPGRQGQPGAGRAEPDRQDLALRQLRGDDRARHQQGPPRRHGPQATRRCPRTRTCWAPARSRCSPRTSGACRTSRRPPRSQAATAPPRHARGGASASRGRRGAAPPSSPCRCTMSPPTSPVPTAGCAAVRRRTGRARSRSTRSGRRSTRAR